MLEPSQPCCNAFTPIVANHQVWCYIPTHYIANNTSYNIQLFLAELLFI